MEYYDGASLAEIVKRGANVLIVKLKRKPLLRLRFVLVGHRVIANLLKRVRDFLKYYRRGMISKEVTQQQALKVLRVDFKGLDHIDCKLLTAMIDLYDGGPVGLGAIGGEYFRRRRNYRRYV